jgi:AraC-like DNA-binding protein
MSQTVVRFSTEDVAPRDRPAVWREVFGRTILGVEVEPLSDQPIRAQATMRALGGLGLMTASTTPVIYRRTTPLIRGDDIVFSFGAAEGSHAEQRGREASAKQGDALLMLGAERAVIGRRTEGSLTCLRVPRAMIASSVVGLEDYYCRRIPGDVPPLDLLARYLGVIEDETLAPELQESAITHILDLVSLTLGATRDVAAHARGRGLRAARLKAIKDEVARNLEDDSLSARTVATRHRLTVRYVQRLFEEAGTTFTEYLIAQRLERARHLVSDPRHAGRTFTAIAFEVGFNDLSYFNRTFRRRFGATPSDLRAAGRLKH